MVNITWLAEGACVSNVVGTPPGSMKFRMEYNSSNSTVNGTGSDVNGTFTATGTFNGSILHFTKVYPSLRLEYNGAVSQTISPNSYNIIGTWGRPDGIAQSGVFTLTVKPEDVSPLSNLTGSWTGQYRYTDQPSQIDGPMTVNFTTFDQTQIYGSGSDWYGSFSLSGRTSNAGGVIVIDMTKSYAGYSWKYYGQLSSDKSRIIGTWGPTYGGLGGSFELIKNI